jgi:Skp family chaperone for outer membrane proteins
MIKTSSFLAALVVGAAAIAAAQGTPPAQGAAPAPAAPAAGRSPRIAVIDMAKVSNDSQLGKSYASQLDALKKEIDAAGTQKQNELTKRDNEIKALQDELEKQGSVLSPEAADRKRQDIVKKTRERQAFLEDGQQELQRMRERAQERAQALNGEFQQKVKPHIEATAKAKGIDILLDSQVALTVSGEFDISSDVVTRLDAMEKGTPSAANRPAPAPKAPAAPAPKPSPAASPNP